MTIYDRPKLARYNGHDIEILGEWDTDWGVMLQIKYIKTSVIWGVMAGEVDLIIE